MKNIQSKWHSITMGRHFSESEVSAMSRNRVEDKGLRNRLMRLKEEKTSTYDFFAKEKKREMEFLKENRKTSGNIRLDFEDTEVSEEMFKSVLLSRRPWSCTPHETTFNVVYREATDPALLKASYLIREKGKKILRRASAKSISSGARSLAVSRQSTRSEPVFQNGRRDLFSAVPQRRTFKSAHHKRKSVPQEIKTDTSNEEQQSFRVAHAVTIVWDDEVKTESKSENSRIKHDFSNLKNPVESEYAISMPDKDGTHSDERVDGTHSDERVGGTHSDERVKDIENRQLPNSDQTITNNDQKGLESVKESKISSREEKFPTDNKNQENISAEVDNVENETSEQVSVKAIVFETQTVNENENINDEVLQTKPNPESKNSKRNKVRKKKRLSIQEPFGAKDREDTVVSTEIFELTEREEKRSCDNKGSDGLPPLSNTSQSTSETNATENVPHVDNSENGIAEKMDRVKMEGITERQMSQVGSTEIHEMVDFIDVNSDPHNFVLDDNCILYKGKVIRDYVKPHLRYKHDPFAKKSRERLIRKLTGDVAIDLKDERSMPIKVHRNYSKGARKRMLKQLVDENNSHSKDMCNNSENDKLEEKIHSFHQSITAFIRLKCS